MDRTPPAYIELDLDDVCAPASDGDRWLDEKTQRIDFERQQLSAEAKLVIGYLTMEEHGMFADLSIEEQERVAAALKR